MERNVADERLVDLQSVDGVNLQVAKGRVPRSEVIDRERNAEVLEFLQRVLYRLGLLRQESLGDLQFEQIRRKLPPDEFEALKSAKTSMPGWMTDVFVKYEQATRRV